MRVKKPKAPRRSSRYLLQADHRLQKLSLKKISSRTAKSKKRPRPVRPANAERTKDGSKDVVRLPWAIDSQAVALIAIVVVMFAVTFAVLVAAHQPIQQSEIATIAATPATDAPPAEATEQAAAPRLSATEAVVPAVSTPRPMDTHATPATISTYATAAASTAAIPVEPAKAVSAEPTRKASETASKSDVEPSPKAEVQKMALVTITGCLERNEGMFWLNDTSGVEAPKSRSWKSGFLKKRPSSIALVDADNGLKLPSHVGHRVAATGTLTNREMRARQLQLVGASCG